MNQESHIRQLLSDIAETEVPAGSLDLAERVRRQASAAREWAPAGARSVAPRGRLLVRPAFAALALVALLAAGLSLLPLKVNSVSAQEALRRAGQATAFGLSGVDSLHGVLETVAPETGSVVREEIWVDVPTASLRKEILWPAGTNFPAELQTDLISGGAAWIWSVPAATPNARPDSISRIDLAELDGALHVVPNPSASLDTPDQPQAGLCAQPGDKLSLLGEETLQGRGVLVIECVIAPAADDAGPLGTRLKLWIDKEIFLVLKYDYYDTTGALFIESRFSQLAINPQIPAERFTFAPPPGVPIEDDRTPADAQPAQDNPGQTRK